MTFSSFFSPKTKPTTADTGPHYDLVFGVNAFEPEQQRQVTISPYVIDGRLYIQVDPVPTPADAGSGWVRFYRYDSKTGIARQLPSPSIGELQRLRGPQQLVFSATKGLHLNTSAKSPDGYSLAEPHWVPVDPISNVLGNVALFVTSGRFGKVEKRESTPRLVKNSVSLAMKSEQPIFRNEAETAFLLGWVEPGKPR